LPDGIVRLRLKEGGPLNTSRDPASLRLAALPGIEIESPRRQSARLAILSSRMATNPIHQVAANTCHAAPRESHNRTTRLTRGS
jgi:hypothetical protein